MLAKSVASVDLLADQPAIAELMGRLAERPSIAPAAGSPVGSFNAHTLTWS